MAITVRFWSYVKYYLDWLINWVVYSYRCLYPSVILLSITVGVATFNRQLDIKCVEIRIVRCSKFHQYWWTLFWIRLIVLTDRQFWKLDWLQPMHSAHNFTKLHRSAIFGLRRSSNKLWNSAICCTCILYNIHCRHCVSVTIDNADDVLSSDVVANLELGKARWSSFPPLLSPPLPFPHLPFSPFLFPPYPFLPLPSWGPTP